MTFGTTPNVFIAGSGRLAGALAGALRRAGAPVLGIWGRTPDRVRAAGARAGVAAFSPAPPDLLLEADVLLVAVADDATAEVAERLAATGMLTRRHTLLKVSGSKSADEVFASVKATVGGLGTLHPLRSVTGLQATPAPPSFKGTIFGVEGDTQGRAAATTLVEVLGGRALALDGAKMALYHAGAAMASNHLIGLLDAAVSALAATGLTRGDALSALVPLVQSTVENLTAIGLHAALTGPIARGDRTTITRHLEALTAHVPEILPVYKATGQRVVEVAKARASDAVPPADALGAIAAALAAPE